MDCLESISANIFGVTTASAETMATMTEGLLALSMEVVAAASNATTAALTAMASVSESTPSMEVELGVHEIAQNSGEASDGHGTLIHRTRLKKPYIKKANRSRQGVITELLPKILSVVSEIYSSSADQALILHDCHLRLTRQRTTQGLEATLALLRSLYYQKPTGSKREILCILGIMSI